MSYPLACVFDAYGTLFDLNQTLKKPLSSLGDDAERFSQLWRSRQLEYAWQRTLMNQYIDFWQVTAQALDFTLETFHIKDPVLRTTLIESYLNLQTYPDVHSTLTAFKEKEIKTAILSNGSYHMILSAVNKNSLFPLFNALLSVDHVEVYKPDPRAYQYAHDHLSIPKQETLFVSSNGWDVAGALNFGFSVAWINRGKGPHEGVFPRPPDYEIDSLSSLLTIISQ